MFLLRCLLVAFVLIGVVAPGADAKRSANWTGTYFEDDEEGFAEFVHTLPVECKMTFNLVSTGDSVTIFVFYSCPKKTSNDYWKYSMFDSDEGSETVQFIASLPATCNVSVDFIMAGVRLMGAIVAYGCPEGTAI